MRTIPRSRWLVVALAIAALVSLVVLLLQLGSDSTRDDVPGVDRRLSWSPPRLSDPEVVQVSAQERSLELDPARDYEVRLPPGGLRAAGGLVVAGGRNVVIMGGEIHVPAASELDDHVGRGLFLRDQTGTVHVEGLLIDGPGLSEGINLDQREGATVQLQNIRIGQIGVPDDDFSDMHPDLLQTWAGPRRLRIDGLTGTTTYQGFFLLPSQFGDQPPPEQVSLRNVDIEGRGPAAYLLWRDEDLEVSTENVWVKPAPGRAEEQLLWPTRVDWPGVELRKPPGGDFVPARSVGIGYESPGYER